jgi:hypothetical protein
MKTLSLFAVLFAVGSPAAHAGIDPKSPKGCIQQLRRGLEQNLSQENGAPATCGVEAKSFDHETLTLTADVACVQNGRIVWSEQSKEYACGAD